MGLVACDCCGVWYLCICLVCGLICWLFVLLGLIVYLLVFGFGFVVVLFLGFGFLVRFWFGFVILFDYFEFLISLVLAGCLYL